jgi:hypothetical protein
MVTILYLTPTNSYLMNIFIVSTMLFKPFIIGLIYYILHILKFNTKVTIIEILLTILLIYQFSLLFDISINNLTNNSNISDYVMSMSDNNTQNIPNDNIPSNRDNPDIPRIIRSLTTNIAALTARRPITKAIALTIANAGNVMADILSNEERANYWIDQYNFYMSNGRFRGGQSGTGPFEIGTNPFLNAGESSGSGSTSNFTSKFDFLRDFLSPVDHSISLETLINVHFILTLGLLILVISLIVLTIYFYINLIILFNKDYFLNKVTNKYVLMYVKYVIFKTRVDIIVIAIITLALLCFMSYVLHYLIIHPIIL